MSRTTQTKPGSIPASLADKWHYHHVKLFISWSKDASHEVAIALRDWVPLVLPFVDPFVSSKDIRKGTRGREIIMRELKDTNQGIICISHQNASEPWLNFEAGALSSHVNDTRVRTVLLNLKPSDVVGPLSDYQHTDLSDRDDMLELIRSLNETATKKLTERLYMRHFNTYWPELAVKLKDICKKFPQPAEGVHSNVPCAGQYVAISPGELAVVKSINENGEALVDIISSRQFGRRLRLSPAFQKKLIFRSTIDSAMRAIDNMLDETNNLL